MRALSAPPSPVSVFGYAAVGVTPELRERAALQNIIQMEYEPLALKARADLPVQPTESPLSRESASRFIDALESYFYDRVKDLKGLYVVYSSDIRKVFGEYAIPGVFRAHANAIIQDIWKRYGEPVWMAAPPSSRVRLKRHFNTYRNKAILRFWGAFEVQVSQEKSGYYPGFDHAADFSWIALNGTRYALGKGRRFVFKALHADWLADGKGVRGADILTEAAMKIGLKAVKMRDVWRGFPLFGPGKLISAPSRGVWQLSPRVPCRCSISM